MIDFELNEQQRALVETARRFAIKEIRPVAGSFDARAISEDCFPWDLVRRAMQLGFGNAVIPERYGGFGGGLLDYALVIEELAYGDAGIADVFLVNISLSRLILKGGDEAQKQRWLTAICEDASGEFILAGPMTEPTGGSEIFCPLPEPDLGVRTRAVRDGDDYVLNGVKCFITSGGVAKLYLVLARTDTDAPNLAGCSIFLVPGDAPGLSFGKVEDKMGHRLSVVREVFFENVRIPKSQRLGEEGDGFRILMECYEGNGVGVGASALGVARAAYDAALEYAQQRVIWGQPIIQYESVAGKLADMRMKIEAGRALLWKLAWAGDNPRAGGGLNRLGSMAKVYPSSIVREITAAAMDIFGGSGFMRDLPIEKYVRDAMLYPIYDGTNDLLKRFLARQLAETPSTTF